ncbi:MAG: hypothetical protein AAFV96_08535, partial [Pseudomonadota bacterium]
EGLGIARLRDHAHDLHEELTVAGRGPAGIDQKLQLTRQESQEAVALATWTRLGLEEFDPRQLYLSLVDRAPA